MQPGESPLAFFLRTQASAEVREVAEDTKVADNRRKDAFWQAAEPSNGGTLRVDFLAEGVQVEAIPGRGRGLRAQTRLEAGAVVLRERPLVAVLLEPGDAEQPMAPVARLAGALLENGLETATRSLQPRPGAEYLEHPARARVAAELTQGLNLARKGHGGQAATISDEDGERLLLTILLNSLGIALQGRRYQGLFSEVGAMANHSSRPNLVFQGAGDGCEELLLVLRAARDVEPGEELTISYLEELYLPFGERDERLQELHGFPAERLPTDASLEAMSSNLSPDKREQAIQRVVAANSAAHDAWEKMATLSPYDDNKELQRLRGLCVSAYAAVLNANVLTETHTWRFNATWRLAHLLTQDDTPQACQKSLQLWDSALRCGLRIWPSELWPEHRHLLRGAIRAAKTAKDETRTAAYQEQMARIEALLEKTPAAAEAS